MIRVLLLCAALLAAAGPARAMTLDNCGGRWRFDHPPQRALVYTHHALENLLALGVGASIIGVVGYSPGEDTAPSPWTAAAELRVRYDRAPWSGEALLAARPDFIYSGSFYWLNGPEAPDRRRLMRWGIASWLSPGACSGLRQRLSRPLSFEDIFAEVASLARIYHRPSGTLIARLRKKVAEQRRKARGLRPQRLVWWYSGLAQPYVAGGVGAPQLLTGEAGSENAFADIPEQWPAVPWEVIAARDPDALVIGDLRRGGPGDSAREKIAFLESNPFTAQMRAVRLKRYLILPGYDMDPSARSALALERLVAGIYLLNPDKELP